MQNLWKPFTWIQESHNCSDLFIFPAAARILQLRVRLGGQVISHYETASVLPIKTNLNGTISIIIKKNQRTCFFHFQTLTQWSRACRKSNSSSVQSSSVLDLELTRVSHTSRRSFVCTQCSDSSHFALIDSRGSCETRSKYKIFLKMEQFYQHVCKISQ